MPATCDPHPTLLLPRLPGPCALARKSQPARSAARRPGRAGPPARLGDAGVAQRGLEAARRLEHAAAAAAAQAVGRAAPGPPAGRALLRPPARRCSRGAARVRAASAAAVAATCAAERDGRVCALWQPGCARVWGGVARAGGRSRGLRHTGGMLAVRARPLAASLRLAGRARARGSTAQGCTRVRRPSARLHRRAQLRQRHSDGAWLSQRRAVAELGVCRRRSGARALAEPGRRGGYCSRIHMHAPAARHGPCAAAFGRVAASAGAGARVEPGRRSRQAGSVHAHAPPTGHGPRACSGGFWDAHRA